MKLEQLKISFKRLSLEEEQELSPNFVWVWNEAWTRIRWWWSRVGFFRCGLKKQSGFFRVEQEWSLNKNKMIYKMNKNEATVFSCWNDDEAEVLGGLWNKTVRRMKQRRMQQVLWNIGMLKGGFKFIEEA